MPGAAPRLRGPAQESGSGVGAGATGAGAGASSCGGAAGAGAAACAPDSTKLRMSFFVTRPPRPVPGTLETSTPCSAAMRATTGETKLLPFCWPSAGAGAAAGSGAGGGAGAASAAGSTAGDSAGWATSSGAAGASGSAAGGASADAPPSPPITASFVPTSTVSPSGTRICVTTPLAGLGTSVSTLSVEISSSASSASICSPSCLSHFVIVPSDTETPICGMTTSTASVVAISTPPTPSNPW